MKHIYLLLSLLFFASSLAQTIQVDGKYEMVFRKSLTVNKNEARTESWGINAPDGFKKIQVRLEVKTLSGEKEIFDPNKFYAVSEPLKIRVRPVDFTYHDFLHMFKSFNKLSTEPTGDNRILAYKPDVHDAFYDYKREDCADVDNAMNFGSAKKPFIRRTYAEPKKWSSNLIDIYVVVPNEVNSFQLYYGAQSLMSVTPSD